MQVWPAVDIRSGKCVRLCRGDLATQMVYGESPADMAIRWVNDGAVGLNVFDLDGAESGVVSNFESVCQIAVQANVPIQVGGGIREESEIQRYLAIGAERLVIGTRAVTEPDWVIQMATKYPGCLWLAVKLHGDCAQTHRSNAQTIDYVRKLSSYPIAGIISCNALGGRELLESNFSAQQQFRDAVDVPMIVSGGVASTGDVAKFAAMNFDGCIIGRALYEGRLTLDDAMSVAQSPSDIGLEENAVGPATGVPIV